MEVATKIEPATPQPQRLPKAAGNKGGANASAAGAGAGKGANNAAAGGAGGGGGQAMQVDDASFVGGQGGGGGGGGGGKMNQGNRRGNFGGRGGRGGNQGGGGGGGGGGGANRQGGGGGGGRGGGQQNFNNRRQQQQDGDESMMSGVGENKRGGGGHQKGMNQRNMRGGGGMGEEMLIAQKLNNLQGPTHEIPSIKYEEVKFSGRNRLYIGNLTNDITEEDLKELFVPFGEVAEIFLNAEKFFAFVKVDYRANAEKAKRELDGYMRSNRALRVRFAPNATTVRVKNLTPHVSNELLYKSFEIFGQIERAVIIVDDRGKPTGEGMVEFTRKSGAMAAIRYCTEKCYFLTSSLRPCVCDLFEHSDDTDGYPEKSLNKKNQDFYNARQMGPRFADFNSFEHEYGTRWKQLHELYKKKHEALNTEMEMEQDKLEAQMEYARYEHETELLRNQLRMREQDRDQIKSNWEMKEKFADEQRIKSEEQMRRTQEEMTLRMGKQEEELRRRQQENTLFMQAQQLNSLLDAQEMNQNGVGTGGGGGGNVGNMGMPPNMGGGNIGGGGGGGGGGGNARKNFDGQNRNFQQGNNNMGNQDGFNDFNNGNGGGGGGGGNMNNNRGGNMGGGNRGQRGGGGGPWNNNQQNDGGNFQQNKRRRF